MGRTLRGFSSEYPYLGARGDVTDADVPDPGLIAKEEAYGAPGWLFGAVPDVSTMSTGDIESFDASRTIADVDHTVQRESSAIAGLGALIIGGLALAGAVTILRRAKGRLKAARRKLARIQHRMDRAQIRGRRRKVTRLQRRVSGLADQIDGLMNQIARFEVDNHVRVPDDAEAMGALPRLFA